ISLLVPAVQKVREGAARTQCLNNLKQIAVAVMNYEGTYKRFPAGSMYRPNAQGRFDYYETWTISILPFLEQGPLFANSYDAHVRNADPGAKMMALRQTLLPVFNCPSDNLPFAPPIQPASGPGGQTSLPTPLSMASTYRCVAGATFGGQSGVDQTGGDANWDD